MWPLSTLLGQQICLTFKQLNISRGTTLNQQIANIILKYSLNARPGLNYRPVLASIKLHLWESSGNGQQIRRDLWPIYVKASFAHRAKLSFSKSYERRKIYSGHIAAGN